MPKNTKKQFNVQYTDESKTKIQSYIGDIPNYGIIYNDDPMWIEFYSDLDDFGKSHVPKPLVK